jgi:hypothetical protein
VEIFKAKTNERVSQLPLGAFPARKRAGGRPVSELGEILAVRKTQHGRSAYTLGSSNG